MAALLSAASLLAGPAALAAEDEEDVVELETFTAEGEVEDDLGLLPTEPSKSIFGFDKTLLETPRSASAVSIETLERFGITEIDDIVSLSPGSFTQSFFGVAGSLDVRGTPGEVYFNGMKRLDNPGNYPSPIGAADQIVIVRGPASPIYGPSKIGGYLDFIPKSARAETGQYLPEATGQVSYTGGTWDKSVVTAEYGGPGEVLGKQFGYYLYGQVENSDSYYENTTVDQTLLQASFNMDLTDRSRISFSGMYHNFVGNQVAGWNRLSQDLIDNGTYVTGLAQPLDTDGDGLISHQEYDAVPTSVFQFDPSDLAAFEAAILAAQPTLGLDPATVGTTTLSGDQVLVSEEDTLESEVLTLYFDYIYEFDSGLSITNKSFFESYRNLSENVYGFSQFGDSWVFENQLVFAYDWELDGAAIALQLSPQIRHTDFERGNDFSNEYFDRRDISQPSTARDKRLLATQLGRDFTDYYLGEYTDYGLALLADVNFDFGLNILAGGRVDYFDVTSRTNYDLWLPRDLPDPGTPSKASDTESGESWTVSVSYELPFGVTPYVTFSEQLVVLADQMADISIDNVLTSNALQGSELDEYGIKGSFLDGRLYAAFSYYEQIRTDFSAQAIVTNQTTETEGFELEARWVVTDNITLTAAFTEVEVQNLTTLDGGLNFSFLGAEDLPGIDPSLFYGGVVNGLPRADLNNPDAIRAGIPENIFSFTGTYDFENGWAVSGTIIDVEETFSGYTQQVELPSYTLINAGLSYNTDKWGISITGKNLTDEEYFRANFPNLFGGTIVLPELPRHYQASVVFKF